MPEPSQDDDVVNLESQPPRGVPRPESLDLETRDIARQRESKRGQIALILLWLLVAITIAPFVLILARAACVFAVSENPQQLAMCGGLPEIGIVELLQLILTPVVALVGAATGFYFGERKGS